jgi:hypothetical protein
MPPFRVFSRISRFLFLTTEGSLLDYQKQWRNPLAGASFAVNIEKKAQGRAGGCASGAESYKFSEKD